MTSPHQVTRDFEAALCEYTGAPYAVAVNSCTMALTLAVAWHHRRFKPFLSPSGWIPRRRLAIEIPKRTYVSVPMAIHHGGGAAVFRDEDWIGRYQLKPLPVWDSARHFTSGMYRSESIEVEGDALGAAWETTRIIDMSQQFVCVSFHASKTLGLEQGGAILHDNAEADTWFRRMRFDGRTEGVAPKDDNFTEIGWHCYMNPSTAAQGLLKLHSLPKHNAPLPNDPYPDLSQFEVFK